METGTESRLGLVLAVVALQKLGQSYGFMAGEGFLISSISPAMFLRKRLCMLFSSMSRSLTTGGRDVLMAAMVADAYS
jgi:hypothetical protein